jgi:uncharacterized membrane protein (UPF0182 family)
MASVRKAVLILLGLLVVLFVLFMLLAGFYTDLLWFRNVGLSSVFWTAIKARIGVFFAFSLLPLAFFLANLLIARKLSEWGGFFLAGQRYYVTSRTVNIMLVIVTLAFALLNGLGSISQWDSILRYLNQRPFGVLDPIFSQDVAFYVFTLPVYRFLRGWLMEILILTLLATAAVYLGVQLIAFRKVKLSLPLRHWLHLAVLGALFFLVLAWGYRLSAFELLYSSRGVAFGASYTDIHAQLLAYNLSLWTVLLCVPLLLGGVASRRPWILGVGAALWLLVAVGVGGIYPALMQQFEVQPNELIKERPYIEYNIDLTLRAYGLDRIEERDFGSVADLTAEALAEAEPTTRNIRLWDYRPLRDTYAQIQEIRFYYEFIDVDVDRYHLDGDYRQVTLSAREMATDQLQSRTWVNEHLQFTHGYGLVMSPVNEVTPEGLPRLLVRDLPPRSVSGLEITRPEIYYGEKTDNYVFVNSTLEEFDYPSGDQNVFTTYDGTGGVLLDSPLKRMAFAYRFGDISVLLSEYLTPESRVMLYRNIHQRVRQVAPFLLFDYDPYLVLLDGRLFWLQDAYTATDMYPYSQPYEGRFNYIRNSVKVAIDVYNGDMTFYMVDVEDPLIQAYAANFPDLFTSLEEMPEGLRVHIRYPEGLFIIQAQMNNTYHMQDPTVFYNKEDLWAVAHEMYAGNDQPMEPYYVTMSLEGEEQPGFVLIQPFTPANKQNMVAWMAARSDGEHYGKLLSYKFPKQELIYGPLQIEARIDQEPSSPCGISGGRALSEAISWLSPSETPCCMSSRFISRRRQGNCRN